MQKAYIAGKLNADAVGYIKNMHQMIKCARYVRGIGYAVYIPCMDFLEGLVNGDFNYGDYFNNSQPFLKACDVVFVCPDSESSVGTQKEIATANELRIPVIYLREYSDGQYYFKAEGFMYEMF